MNNYSQTIKEAASHIQNQCEQAIDFGIILGSGLGDSIVGFEESYRISFAQLNGLPTSSVPSHNGVLLLGKINNKHVAICQGRFHLYEGYSAQQVVMPVYLLKLLGAQKLIITNASGSLNADFKAGEVMMINDHINFTGHNPVLGQDDTFGIQFTDMSQAYDVSLRELSSRLAEQEGITLHSGIYAGVLGPSLETSAERRFMQTAGADAVGMSTVLEVIAANHCGLKVLALSAIANMALGDRNQQADTLESTLKQAGIAGEKIGVLLNAVLKEIETMV